MKETVIEILKIIAPLSVALIVFAQGLAIAPSEVGRYLMQKPMLMLRALVATLVLVPAAALALILVLKASPALAIGLAILVACPPAPLMLKAAPKKGDASAAFMASLHLLLALLAFVTVPAVLHVLANQLGFEAEVDLGKMAAILARTILLPIGLGLTVRAFWPGFAERAAPVLGMIGTVGLAIVVLFAIVALYPAMLNMDRWSYLVIAAVSVAALAIGHLLGPDDAGERTTLAVECGVRHPVLALTIAATNFSPEKALPVLVPCVITFILIAMVYMAWRGRRSAAQAPTN